MKSLFVSVFFLMVSVIKLSAQQEYVVSCTVNPCDRNATCYNDTGSIACICDLGFQGNGIICDDVDECQETIDTCARDTATCVNTKGSYSCTCKRGYSGDGRTCDNINECDEDRCHPSAMCHDTPGSFQCLCGKGFTSDTSECVDINECEMGIDDCDRINGMCINTDGNYTCECNRGYSGDGKTCSDINECYLDLDNCAETTSTCVNNEGSYLCRCNQGYSSNGTTCIDINECEEKLDDCADNTATCVNSVGSFLCTCKNGYSGNGRTCADVDECLQSLHNCANNTSGCKNTEGSFACQCIEGYLGDGTKCNDINECEENIDNCANNIASCINTEGSFLCQCNQGYTGSGITCTDVDECYKNLDNCASNTARCINTEGSFLCRCNDGYSGNGTVCEASLPWTTCQRMRKKQDNCADISATCTNTEGSYSCQYTEGCNGDGITCTDINECEENLDNCANTTASCVNIGGSFACQCITGYRGNGTTCSALCVNRAGSFACRCMEGYAGNGIICVDVNECDENLDNCANNRATCSNTEGSFVCQCNAGYTGNGVSCTDIDECNYKLDICAKNASTCVNTEGSFLCDCNIGYSGNGTVCDDINECGENLDSCANNTATCLNNEGSYTCLCNEGYTGNGMFCTDIDECVLYLDNCAKNTSTCVNIEGSYMCLCNSGYSGNGTVCADVDECHENINDCANNIATCANFEGSFTCSCNEGYSGNGKVCIDVNECALNIDNCAKVTSTCVNIDGSFTCRCNIGYSGNGSVCTDINECEELVGGCANNTATCVNTVGSYTCKCNEGFTGDGKHCADIQNCLVEGVCGENAICIDTPGSFECTCQEGFVSNGFSCTEKEDVKTSETPFCAEQIIPFDNEVYRFGRTELYQLGASVQRCNETDLPLAAVSCVKNPASAANQGTGGQFDPSTLVVVSCGITINDAGNSSVFDLRTLTVLTAEPETLFTTDIEIASQALNMFLNQTEYMQINERTLSLATATVSNLYAGEQLTSRQTDRSVRIKSNLLNSLNNFTDRVNLSTSDSRINVITQDISLQLQHVSEVDLNNEFELNLTNARTSSTVVANVPVNDCPAIRSLEADSATVYATLLSERFPLTNNQNTSQVISLGVQGVTMNDCNVTITYVDLQFPEAETEVNNNSLERQLNQAEFVQWDYAESKWIPALHCDATGSHANSFHCNKIATYSILFSKRIVPSAVALTAVSYVGCALSIIFLLATIIIYLKNKELRNKSTTMILVNICACLIGVYFFYAIGVGRVSNHKICDALAFLLHFFTLASFSWMSLNSFKMYRAFTTLNYRVHRLQRSTYFLAYGFPFIIVLFNFSLTVLYLDNQHKKDIFFESLYRARYACWLREPSLYWGFLLPLGMSLLYNFVVFGILLKIVIFKKEKIRSTDKGRNLVERLINAVTMITVMGLTWIFGYFLLVPHDVTYHSVMQWLFTIFNVLQGVVIFFLYCYRRESIRRVWFQSNKKKKPAVSLSSGQETTKSETSRNQSIKADHAI